MRRLFAGKQLAGIVCEDIRGDAIEKGMAHFSVRVSSDNLASFAQSAFSPWVIRTQEKCFYAYRRSDAKKIDAKCDEALSYRPIDRSLLETGSLENCEDVRREIVWMWPSLDRYYQYGFGRAAAAGNRIVCWCTSEYCSESFCGIGIETVPDMQNQGIATAAACRFVSASLERGLTPHWEADVENPASIRVAEKAGFELVERAEAINGHFR
jgi:RimJ/RimL family protein N-acetyltransferase